MPVQQHRDIEVVGDDQEVFVRGQRAGDFFGGGADIDEQRAAVRNLRRRGSANRLLLLGGNEAAGFVGEILDAGGNDGAAMDSGKRPAIAEIVEVLADGLRLDLEAPGQILHHHPAEGAGDVQDFGLAMGQAGHGAPRGRTRPSWCGGSGVRSTRQTGLRRRTSVPRSHYG
jgi:hypothetical protein